MDFPGTTAFPPKIIWVLWLQGWDAAPRVARSCLRSWRSRNPDWIVHALDLGSLTHFLPEEILEKLLSSPKEPEALSDQIRLELLHRYGGVWADATAMCMRPLDEWLDDAMPKGFFAFARPGPDRMLSTWFLAAEKGADIIAKWRDASWAYWDGRQARDAYFWVHNLFATTYAVDAEFRHQWDATPQISAVHPFHFGPDSVDLLAAPPADIAAQLRDPPAPVFKLTHKFGSPPEPGSLFDMLCQACEVLPWSRGPARRIMLVAWYGSFAGHGTIGDLRSLEAMVTHLVGRGHFVLHATAAPLTICGAARVDWRYISTDVCDAILFVCGPIIRSHPETAAFFARFDTAKLVGIGVSLFAEDHDERAQPFAKVFARQGEARCYGDIAIVAPRNPRGMLPSANARLVVGLALRGEQGEYGTDVCMSQETGAFCAVLVELLQDHGLASVITIENHLGRAGCAPAEIEALYAQCDLVVTTRFHGAVMALRAHVPFIAIDQIRGGAKVAPLLEQMGWPAVMRADQLGPLDLIREALCLLNQPQYPKLAASRMQHVHAANRTLRHFDVWLEQRQAG
jgi:hypothetical protein